MQEKFHGYMLHHTRLSESRIIVDLFTLEGGRRQAVLRLGKKESRALLTPMTLLSFQLTGREHQALKRLDQWTVEAHCYDLAAHYAGLALVGHWGALVRLTQPEEQADARIFRLLAHVTAALKAASSLEVLHHGNLYFETWLLHFCGVLPRRPPPRPARRDEESREERLCRALDRRMCAYAFQLKIEEYLPFALKLGSLSRTTAVLGTLWERLLDREVHMRRVFYKQFDARGRLP